MAACLLRNRFIPITQTTRNIVRNQSVDIAPIPISDNGLVDPTELDGLSEDIAPSAVIIQQPNFFGGLEAVDVITDWAHARGALVIAVVNPMSLGVLKAPGQWGEHGADIAVGDGQPCVPMAWRSIIRFYLCPRRLYAQLQAASLAVPWIWKIGWDMRLPCRPVNSTFAEARRHRISVRTKVCWLRQGPYT